MINATYNVITKQLTILNQTIQADSINTAHEICTKLTQSPFNYDLTIENMSDRNRDKQTDWTK